MYDVIIKNGIIIDGSGGIPYQSDIGIKDGIVATIAPRIDEQALRIIDASGLQVSPGFIDNYTHSDSENTAIRSQATVLRLWCRLETIVLCICRLLSGRSIYRDSTKSTTAKSSFL